MFQLIQMPAFQELHRRQSMADFNKIKAEDDEKKIVALHNRIAGRQELFDYVQNMANAAVARRKDNDNMADSM